MDKTKIAVDNRINQNIYERTASTCYYNFLKIGICPKLASHDNPELGIK